MQYVEEHLINEEICLEAVKQNGLSLQFAKEYLLNEEICLEAIKQNGMSLQYVEKQTEEMCLEASKYIDSLQFVKEKTQNILEEY